MCRARGMADHTVVRSVLASQWADLMPSAPSLGDELLQRWSAPGRYYHDLRHLHEALTALDSLGSPTQIEYLAIWFHDSVYANQPSVDERKSAELATRRLTDELPPPDIAEICRLILLTATHQVDSNDDSGARVCDADLAILGASPNRYRESVADLRREHANVPDGEWRRLRQQVLAAHLQAASPFHTSTAVRLWQAQAHRNLCEESTALNQ